MSFITLDHKQGRMNNFLPRFHLTFLTGQIHCNPILLISLVID